MKKVLLCLISLFFLFFSIGNINALNNDVKIIVLIEESKSSGIDSTIENFDNLNMKINLSMYNINDEITYKMTLKNNTNKDLMVCSKIQRITLQVSH